MHSHQDSLYLAVTACYLCVRICIYRIWTVNQMTNTKNQTSLSSFLLFCLAHFCLSLRIDKGPFMEHLPVILVAQEWRRWAMEILQHNLSPKPEIKAGRASLLCQIPERILENAGRHHSVNSLGYLGSWKMLETGNLISIQISSCDKKEIFFRSFLGDWMGLEMCD